MRLLAKWEIKDKPLLTVQVGPFHYFRVKTYGRSGPDGEPNILKTEVFVATSRSFGFGVYR